MKIGLSFFIVLMSLTLVSSCFKRKDSNERVINLVIPQKVKGMDPIFANDTYSGGEVSRVYEGLYEYHYLKRPFELIPNLALEMPTISEDGLTYTIKIKKGVLFHDDECFPNGKGREMVAQDVIYSFKRLADPKLQSAGWWVIDDKLVGVNEWRDRYADQDRADYSEEIEGLKALDKYTLQFKLSNPYPQFLFIFAMPFTFIVPKEAVFFYKKNFLNHPVGTGAYILPVYRQTNKIVYKKNPTFRTKLYPNSSSEEYKKAGFLVDAGKKLPLVEKLIVHTLKESQARWLNFRKGKLDFIGIPKDNFKSAITPSKGLTKELQQKGITLLVTPALDITYIAFNMGMKLFQNLNLRKAMSLAFDIKEVNTLFYSGNGIIAQSIVPPGLDGHLKNFKNENQTNDLKLAKEYLSKAGYPDGKGLPVIAYDCTSSTVSKQRGESFKRQMDKIGIQIKVRTNTWPELQKKVKNRSIQLYGMAWSADYPDAENFLQLLYGPNKSPGPNGSGFNNNEYNLLFKKVRLMAKSKERTALYEKLNRMAADHAPLIFGVHRQGFKLHHQWLKNFIDSDFEHGRGQYLNISIKEKKILINKL